MESNHDQGQTNEALEIGQVAKCESLPVDDRLIICIGILDTMTQANCGSGLQSVEEN